MQAYQRACGEVIARYDGHVAQYLGDGLMVYFGWPGRTRTMPCGRSAPAWKSLQAVSKLNASTPIRARVGIHTGVVVVGETGQGDASVPKAAVGETPNIAARLQALAEPGSVVVSERTRALGGRAVRLRRSGCACAQGRVRADAPVPGGGCARDRKPLRGEPAAGLR